jgi:hypothetical protein
MVPRKAAPGPGEVRLRARGLCASCYATAWKNGSLVDHERSAMTREEMAEEWRMLADRHRQHRENAELIAPRLGTNPRALERTMRRWRQDQRRLAS